MGSIQFWAAACGCLFSAAGLGWVAWRLWRRDVLPVESAVPASDPVETHDADPFDADLFEESPVAPQNDGQDQDIGSLVNDMLAHGRYALLLRRQLVSSLSPKQFQRARTALRRQMSLVPEGDVVLEAPPADDETADEMERSAVRHVDALFLDRYPVTNRQYRQFVQSGGYEQMAIWDAQIWPAVLDFIDETGCPGPRFWKDGAYPAGEDDHPVVGVSWYEAGAYARWVGKRLPGDAEWVKAGCWPVPMAGSRPLQRRYPWGDTMDRQRCNLWGPGPGRTVSVAEYPSGLSVGGVYQLIGNVWEWTTGNFGVGEHAPRDLNLTIPMKSIRGGAFDTYFENQATCQFQTGESPLSRKHNIGFRCALSICDVAAAPPSSGDVVCADADDGPADDEHAAGSPAPVACEAGELVAAEGGKA
ncbi:MAG TPA: formylglycine-generating enzyme family protein [Pirellulales bacterium]|nr:formylglycine-generating enzyme family protein [Pirellulales bacterium]